MRDGVNPHAIPVDTELVAGYCDGIYGPNHAQFGQPGWDAAAWLLFPRSECVHIAVSAATDDGEWLDVERYDATPDQAPGWAVKRRARGVAPGCYVNRSNAVAVIDAFTQQRVTLPRIWLSTLDGTLPWDFVPNIVAIQHRGAAQTGGGYDESMVSDAWTGGLMAATLDDISVKLDQLIGMIGGTAGRGHSSLLWDGAHEPYLSDIRNNILPKVAARDDVAAVLAAVQKLNVPQVSPDALTAVLADIKGTVDRLEAALKAA